MHGKPSLSCILIACVCVAAARVSLAADPQPARTSLQNAILQTGGSEPSVTLPTRAAAATRHLSPENSTVQRFSGQGQVAADLPGTTVYSNEIISTPDNPLQIWEPGAGEMMAEDIELAPGACDVVYFNLAVAGFGETGLTFDVHVALWDGDPCETGSAVILGTEADITDVPNNGYAQLLEMTFVEPVAVPEIVWLAATFSTSDSGWAVAEEAELGYTRDLFSEYDIHYGCVQLFLGGDPYAGFWANINCELAFDPPGACCNGETCTEVTEASCTGGGGAWSGAFSTCNPSPCLTGACCTEDDYGTCVDTTKAVCAGMQGFFHASTTCASAPCRPQFHLYRNDGDPAGYYAHIDGTILADDQAMAAGAPCELSSFDLSVYGFGFTGAYDVAVELWTVDQQSSTPLAPIPGAAAVFSGVGDGAYHKLLAGPFTGITLPEQVWMVMTTSTDDSGWLITEQATVGRTEDYFASYNGSVWNTLFFGGDPWAGFGANLRCYGIAPTGACCTDTAGTCIDGLLESQCGGRWLADATCDPDPFNPPCGTSACCTIMGGCQDMLPSECETYDGEVALGLSCADINNECPRIACIGASGDCFSEHGTPGCEDGFCCETVCKIDSACCTTAWDNLCAEKAEIYCEFPPPNDNCADSEVITGEGQFDFDNTTATTDGPPHAACSTMEGDEQTIHDVWYCWTAPCTDTVYIQTCGLTGVDTKINVYNGCDTCPPTGAGLVTCNDDFCGYDPDVALQSQVSFGATDGQDYLIRVGTFPGGTDPGSGTFEPVEGGTGKFRISCGIPDNPACPGTGDCYSAAGTGTPGCVQDDCCNIVCACDAYCCEVEWDGDCATYGFEGSDCGAAVLCEGPTCPFGEVRFVEPPAGVVDACQPHPPADSQDRQGIDTLLVEAPEGADKLECWSLCETVVEGVSNRVRSVVDNGNGTMTVGLIRSISTDAVTTVTYTNDVGTSHMITLTSHPANVNGDSQAAPSDILEIIDYINGVATSLWGIYSEDVDRSGQLGPPDILRVIDLLNGAGQYDPWLNTPLPDCGDCCR